MHINMSRFTRIRSKLSSKTVEKALHQCQILLTQAACEIYPQLLSARDKLDLGFSSPEATHEEISKLSRKEILDLVYPERYDDNIEKDVHIKMLEYLAREILLGSDLEIKRKATFLEQETQTVKEETSVITKVVKETCEDVIRKLQEMGEKLKRQIEESKKSVRKEKDGKVDIESLKSYYNSKALAIRGELQNKQTQITELKKVQQSLKNELNLAQVKMQDWNGAPRSMNKKLQDQLRSLDNEVRKIKTLKKDLFKNIQTAEREIKILESSKDDILAYLRYGESIENEIGLSLEALVLGIEQGNSDIKIIKGMVDDLEKLEDKEKSDHGGQDEDMMMRRSLGLLNQQRNSIKSIEQRMIMQVMRLQSPRYSRCLKMGNEVKWK
jgi:chromosome segregation ATPase